MDLRGECVSFTGWLSRNRDDYTKLIRGQGGSQFQPLSKGESLLGHAEGSDRARDQATSRFETHHLGNIN
jgi:hypothetical protein